MARESARRRDERLRSERIARLRRRGAVQLLRASTVGVVALAWTGRIGLSPLTLVVAALAWVMVTRTASSSRRSTRGRRPVARTLDELGRASRALHHRRVPASPVTIDHVLVAATGVWTVQVHPTRSAVGAHGREARLHLDGRDRSDLLDGSYRQADALRWILDGAGMRDVEVRPVLCLPAARWPRLRRPRALGGVELLEPRELSRLLVGGSRLSLPEIARVAALIDRSLEPLQWRPTVDPRSPLGREAPTGKPSTTRLDGLTPPAPGIALHSAPVVREWHRAGRRRLYVRSPEGELLGYVDLVDNEVVALAEQHRVVITEAAARYLRDADN